MTAMSAVTIQLPDDVERELQARAQAQGQDVASVALDLLRASLAESKPNADPNKIPYEQWHAAFRAWAASATKIDVVVDDRRETIYEGR
jgi:plasmid stability protein